MTLYLYGCVALEGSVEPLGALQELLALDVEACFGLQGGVHVLAALPKIKFLNISDTQLAADGFVGACKVGRRRNERTPLWKAANCGQVHTARRLLEGTADRRGVKVDRATTDDGTTPLIQAADQQLPWGRRDPPPASCRCEPGAKGWSDAIAARRADGVSGGGPAAPRAQGGGEPGEQEQVDSAPHCRHSMATSPSFGSF